MIARHEAHIEKTDVWSKLAAALPDGVIYWRQDGKPTSRDGKHFARFVAYIEANTVRERLDSVVPGEWDLTLDLLPPLAAVEEGADAANCSFKARLQILGVIREDVGTGKDYKQAATDAFKRAAVRFGVGHELYAYEQNWVQVDGEGRYAKPLEDPQAAYTRRYGARPAPAAAQESISATSGRVAEGPVLSVSSAAPSMITTELEPSCPKCSGRMWDNRATKRNPKAPDFKCRDRSCDGVVWPAKPGSAAPRQAEGSEPEMDSATLATGTDDIPF